jgi:hypothetical protein
LDSQLLHICSKHLVLRPATRRDVPLIYSLRRSERGRNLNHTDPDIEVQYKYFENYLKRFESGEEIYYVIVDRVVIVESFA